MLSGPPVFPAVFSFDFSVFSRRNATRKNMDSSILCAAYIDPYAAGAALFP